MLHDPKVCKETQIQVCEAELLEAFVCVCFCVSLLALVYMCLDRSDCRCARKEVCGIACLFYEVLFGSLFNL